jgi:hypothetical protein
VEFEEGRPPEIISEVQQQSSALRGEEPIRVEIGAVERRAEGRAAETPQSLAPLGPAISEVCFGSNHDTAPQPTQEEVESPSCVPNYVDRMEDSSRRTRKDTYLTFQAIRSIVHHHEHITAEDFQKRKRRLDEVQKEYFQQLDIVHKMRGVPSPYP